MGSHQSMDATAFRFKPYPSTSPVNCPRYQFNLADDRDALWLNLKWIFFKFFHRFSIVQWDRGSQIWMRHFTYWTRWTDFQRSGKHQHNITLFRYELTINHGRKILNQVHEQIHPFYYYYLYCNFFINKINICIIFRFTVVANRGLRDETIGRPFEDSSIRFSGWNGPGETDLLANNGRSARELVAYGGTNCVTKSITEYVVVQNTYALITGKQLSMN